MGERGLWDCGLSTRKHGKEDVEQAANPGQDTSQGEVGPTGASEYTTIEKISGFMMSIWRGKIILPGQAISNLRLPKKKGRAQPIHTLLIHSRVK